MIQITKNLQLKEISNTDCETLFTLMNEIYALAYSHFWEDSGDWYVNAQYSQENILKELNQENADYYFVLFNDEIIGIYRIIWDEKLEGLSEEKQVKLHRLYLHKKSQGNGIGKMLLTWLEQEALKKGYNIIWLDAMNEQPQAFQFYKKLDFVYHSHTYLPYDLLFDDVRKMSQVYKMLT